MKKFPQSTKWKKLRLQISLLGCSLFLCNQLLFNDFRIFWSKRRRFRLIADRARARTTRNSRSWKRGWGMGTGSSWFYLLVSARVRAFETRPTLFTANAFSSALRWGWRRARLRTSRMRVYRINSRYKAPERSASDWINNLHDNETENSFVNFTDADKLCLAYDIINIHISCELLLIVFYQIRRTISQRCFYERIQCIQ